jgi:hypothetical protein
MRSVVRSIWASVQGDATFMRRLNGWLTWFWILMIPVSIITGWVRSVTYVSALSLWALVSGHWSTWQAARVEVAQQREALERESNPVEQRVVDALVDQTEIAAT